MAKYKSIVITNSGLALVAATYSGGTIEFTAIKTGNGVYDGTETLEDMTDLKSVKQSFGITGITREEAVVKVRSVLSNEGMTEGYYITEIGLYAMDPATKTEILYAIVLAEDNMADYFPPYSEFPQSMTLETYIKVTGLAEGVTFTASNIPGIYVTVQDLEDHVNAENPHEITKATIGLKNVDNTSDKDKPISTAVQAALDEKAKASDLTNHTSSKNNPHGVTATHVGLGNVPNVATNDQTPTYTVASSNTALTSGEKLSVAFGKIAKAISSLISHLANKSNPHGVTAAQVGLGNVNNTADNAKSVKYATSAGSATSATSATKATQDGDGNVIADTYLKKKQIANNLTTTTEGMVLDATQGKALDDKIVNINSNLSVKTIINNGFTVRYDTNWVNIRQTTLSYSQTVDTTNETMQLPSNVIPKVDLQVTGQILSSAWKPTSINCFVNLVGSSNKIQIRVSNTISAGVLVINETFPRDLFQIT